MNAIARLTLSALLAAGIASGVCATTNCLGVDIAFGGPEAATPDNTLSAAEKALGYKLLFDGETLNNWKCTGPNNGEWVVQDGAIFCTGKPGPYLYTAERYGDFELKLDFMVDYGANSGLFFRLDDLSDPVQTGIEMQILDTAATKTPGKSDCGAIYDCLAPSENAMKPAIRWNSVVLRCKRNMIAVTMNGKRIIYMDLDKWTKPHQNPDGTPNKYPTAYKDMSREGFIGMQNYGNKVWFRNIKIAELK